jgi:hypothetical protein
MAFWIHFAPFDVEFLFFLCFVFVSSSTCMSMLSSFVHVPHFCSYFFTLEFFLLATSLVNFLASSFQILAPIPCLHSYTLFLVLLLLLQTWLLAWFLS